MRTNTWPVALLVAMVALLPLPVRAQTPPPQVAPGETFTIQFPDMPPTMACLLDPKNPSKPSMTVFLPTNYDARIKHPLLIFLKGEGGGNGNNPNVARGLAEDKDFICVDLPLFKKKADGNAPTTLQLDDSDYKYMWSFHKKMLDKLHQVVPNIDPSHSVLGGFSNGGHATAGLIEQTDGEVLRTFAAFLFVEGGGRLKQVELLKDRPVLLAYGSRSTRQSRIQEIEGAMRSAGVNIVVHEMKDTGHAFPESQYPAVSDWLHNVVMKAEVKMTRPVSKPASQP